MAVIDISNQASPVVLSTLSESALGGGQAGGVTTISNYVYVANGTDGLRVVDVSNPSSPVMVASVLETIMGNSVASSSVVVSNYLYLANSQDGLRIIDLTHPASPVLLGNLSLAAMGAAGGALSCNRTVVAGHYAYVANGGGGISVLDVSNPASPTVITNIPESVLGNGSALALTIAGNNLFVANASSISVLNVANPASPLPVANLAESSFNYSGTADSIAASGNYVYVANDNDGLRALGYFTTVSGMAFAGNGSLLTSLSASNLLGTIPMSSLPSSILLNNGNAFFLTNVNAAALVGSVSSTHLPPTLAYVNANQTFTGTNTFQAGANQVALHVTDGTNSHVSLQTLGSPNSGFSSIDFNGYFNGAEQRYNTAKLRWRMFADQRGTSDQLAIDTYNGTSLSTVLSIPGNGYLGINLANPARRLHVYDASNNVAMFDSTSTIGTWMALNNSSTGANEWDIAVTGSANSEGPGRLIFYTQAGGGARKMMLDNSGNLTTAGTVNGTSDRNAKHDFAPVDTEAVLEKISALPIQTWSYTNDPPELRHLGPMAQDFFAAFNLGQDDRHISMVDADGVALAAIQGLNAKLCEESKAKDKEIQELKQNVEELRKLVQSLANKKQ